uniref:Maturation protein n=1 Tax=Dundee virus TaxID=2707216 RepID=A0A6H0DIM4_9VIRU|nr:MAG: hypothetical protein [Dundee virus]
MPSKEDIAQAERALPGYDFYRVWEGRSQLNGAIIHVDASTQKKGDFLKPLPYKRRIIENRWHDSLNGTTSNPEQWLMHTNHNLAFAKLYPRAYDSATEKLRNAKLELGMDLATMSQTMEMFASNAARILNGLRYVRKGRFGEAARAIGNPALEGRLERASRRKPHPHRRYYLNDFGGQYLEYTYGVSPLLQEIHTARVALDTVAAWDRTVKGSTQSRQSFVREWSRESKDNWDAMFTVYHEHYVQVGFAVKVNNPNHALLSALGLTNPLIVINDLIPFSFVVNWFTGHEAYLNSLDAFVGYDVVHSYISERRDTHMTGWKQLSQQWQIDGKSRDFLFERKLNADRPTFTDRFELWPFSSQRRALNATALTLAQFKQL